MNETLIIWLAHDPAVDARWLPVDATGRALGSVQRGPLAQAAAMTAERRVVVAVPAEDVLLTEVSLPGLRGARLRQAVPFALEDRLAVDVEHVHCALGPAVDDDVHQVAAVERAVMERWLAALRDAGITPAAVVPDCLALPWDGDGATTVALTPTRALVRDGAAAGFACEHDLLEPMFAARAHESPPTRVAVAEGAAPPAAFVGTPVTELRDGLLAWLAPQLVGSTPSLDLLQGPYAPKRRRTAALGAWRWPAMLAAAWLALAVVTWALEYRALAAEHARQQAEIAEIFASVITDEPMVDPRLQLERRLGGAADGELLRLLEALAAAMAGAEGVEVSGLSYRSGQLDVSVAARTVDQLDRLRERVAAGGVAAAIDSASSAGDAVAGRLRLTGAAP